MQEKYYNVNKKLIKVVRKIDEILKRNSIYELQEKINKILKFFISIEREQEKSVTSFLDLINSNNEYNSTSKQSKSKFFGKIFFIKNN
jgi:hypothetical protein